MKLIYNIMDRSSYCIKIVPGYLNSCEKREPYSGAHLQCSKNALSDSIPERKFLVSHRGNLYTQNDVAIVSLRFRFAADIVRAWTKGGGLRSGCSTCFLLSILHLAFRMERPCSRLSVSPIHVTTCISYFVHVIYPCCIRCFRLLLVNPSTECVVSWQVHGTYSGSGRIVVVAWFIFLPWHCRRGPVTLLSLSLIPSASSLTGLFCAKVRTYVRYHLWICKYAICDQEKSHICIAYNCSGTLALNRMYISSARWRRSRSGVHPGENVDCTYIHNR